MSAPRFYHERVEEDLLREIAWTIAHKIRDPRVPPLTSVSAIRLSEDCRNATVLMSIYADEKQRQEALEALNGAASFIQHVVSQRVKTKHFPRLCFRLDRGLDNSQRINELLNDVKADLE